MCSTSCSVSCNRHPPSGGWRFWEKDPPSVPACIWRKEKTQNRASQGPAGLCLSSLCLLPHRAQHRSPRRHICQTLPARQPVRGLALPFQSMRGLSLNQHPEQREKKGMQPLCQTPSLPLHCAALVNVHFNVCYIYNEFMCQ